MGKQAQRCSVFCLRAPNQYPVRFYPSLHPCPPWLLQLDTHILFLPGMNLVWGVGFPISSKGARLSKKGLSLKVRRSLHEAKLLGSLHPALV